MKLTITGSEFLLLQEERIVHQRQCVEHIELVALGDNKGVVNKFVKALLESSFVELVLQRDICTVVKHVSNLDNVVLRVSDSSRLDAEEREEVSDLLVFVLVID